MLPDDYTTLLTRILGLLIVVSLAVVVYMAFTPYATADPYTEFYILGTDGNASDYPTNLSVGETGNFIVGITNREHRTVTYTIVLRMGDGILDSRTNSVNEGTTWEEPVSFEPQSSGRQKLEILLYLGSDPDTSSQPYRDLWLWVEVHEQAG